MDQALALAARDTGKTPGFRGKADLRGKAGIRPLRSSRGSPPLRLPRHPDRQLSEMVAGAFGVRPCDLAGTSRGCAKVALARQAAMYLARVSLGMTLSEAAGLFRRDRTTAAHACRVIEDLRDDARFDAKLASIEEALQ